MGDTNNETKALVTEIVQKRPDGTEEVKYRAAYGSEDAKDLIKQVDSLTGNHGYFYRHV